MPLTAAQIVTLATQDAKCPGFTSQAGQLLNAMLQDLCQDWDLDQAQGTFNFTFNSATGNGSGPYTLPADYLRTQVIDGKDEFFYTINGVPYPLIQVTRAEYDWLVQTPGFNSYPYNYATDLSVSPPNLFVWPPASGSYACTLRYQRLMPDIVTPETSNTVPWFPNTQILLRGLAGRLMGLTGDARQAEYLGGGEGEASLKYPLGFMTLLNQYLKNAKDREGAVKTVGKDRRRWGRPFDQLKNTKNIGWALAVFIIGCALYLFPAEEAHANCTTPCTKAQITTDINTNWPDNTTGQITPALLRSTVLDLVNSYVDTNGNSSLACAVHQWVTGFTTLSSLTCAQPAASDLSNGVTGSGAVVLGTGPSISGPTFSGTIVYSGLASGTCTNSLLINASNQVITGVCPGSASSIQVGTTSVTGGTSTRILYNNAGVLGNETIVSALGTLATVPSRCVILTTAAATCNNGGSAANNGTYTTPAGALWLEVELVGGGAGGGGGSTAGGTGTAGQNTTFGTALLAANGGSGGLTGNNGNVTGGTASGCAVNITGGDGQPSIGAGGATANGMGSVGGMNPRFAGGGSGGWPANNGVAGIATTGGGGGGGGGNSATAPGGTGGGAGGYCWTILTSPNATYAYAVAAAVSGGTVGTAGSGAGGQGAAGQIIITAHFNY